MRPQFFLAVVLLLVALAIGVLAVPGRLGSIFVVSGNSMEPDIHDGDLVIAVAQPTYRVGEVVVYEHQDLGPVLHRIVRERDGQFVMRGDNRDEPDAYQVMQSAVRGRLALRIPAVGGMVEALQPVTLFSIIVALGSRCSS